MSNGWNKLLPRESLSTDDLSAEGDVEEVFHDLGYEARNETWQSPEDWIAENSSDTGYQMMSDAKIVAQVCGESTHPDDDTEDEADPVPTVSHSKAHEALGITLECLEAQGTDPANLLLIKG